MPDHPNAAVPENGDTPATPPITRAEAIDPIIEELPEPVPITVWHVPAPPGRAAASAQLTRRLVVNYSPPGGPVLDLTGDPQAITTGTRDDLALVITDWPRPATSARRHLRACARQLRSGGCLAVVVPTIEIPDQLGRLVAAARTAGLTYLQHIVAAHHLNQPPPAPVPRACDHARCDRAEGQLRVHTDVLVFRKPTDHDA